MRRRQILPANDEQQRQRIVAMLQQTPPVNFGALQEQAHEEMVPPADHEACPLCGRKKVGRPKGK